jgi:thioredoxin 1
MSKFFEIINSDVPTLVDFSAEWCGPCKMMAPILKEVAGKIEGKARILKVDIDKNPAVANQFQVQSVPTLILFRKGQVKWRQSGVVQGSQLIQVITNNSR